jgi:hypothetical protein
MIIIIIIIIIDYSIEIRDVAFATISIR